MKHFLIRLSIFLIPVLLISVVIYWTDPYGYFHKDKANDLKSDIAFVSDYGRRSSFISYKNDPKPNVILGYSQANIIDVSDIPESGWCKFTFGGADTWEVVESFDVIRKNPALKKVIIDITPFNYMHACSRIYDRTLSYSYSAIELNSNPTKYFYDRQVVWSTLTYLKSNLFHDSSYKEKVKPFANREIFWRHKLKTGRDVFSGNPQVSRQALISALTRVKEYCDSNNIELKVFSTMTHTDLQKISEPFKSTVFLPDMLEIFGFVFDFDFPNSFTKDSANFADPIHALSGQIYIDAFWKGQSSYYQLISKDRQAR